MKNKKTEETKKKMSATHKRIGTRPPIQNKKRSWGDSISEALISAHKNKFWGFQKGHKINNGRKQYPYVTELNRKRLIGKTGEDSLNWRGGLTSINKLIRNSLEYEEWRTKVFERDLYTCQDCGQIGGYLEADHIKPFSLFLELRFDINNGRTLCKSCHRKTDTYGRGVFNFRGRILNWE